jgi:hypothetical protein
LRPQSQTAKRVIARSSTSRFCGFSGVQETPSASNLQQARQNRRRGGREGPNVDHLTLTHDCPVPRQNCLAQYRFPQMWNCSKLLTFHLKREVRSCATIAGLTESQLPRPFSPAYRRRASRVPTILSGPMDQRQEISSNWASGRPSRTPSAMPTAFETRARELSLTAPMYADSQQLRRWCEDNLNKCYIPEWLLKAWGISVNSDEL